MIFDAESGLWYSAEDLVHIDLSFRTNNEKELFEEFLHSAMFSSAFVQFMNDRRQL